ncbi:hypothetical protein MVEN_01704000 [Mycena venus]|uniref:Uncharacterized protein n=1 Tax=Mycena venus TaxID=2733690 RepID=A0A8H6XMT0_9AGAR|nr:hypothetical protein MVEN_01704000 [Mycena venus]
MDFLMFAGAFGHDARTSSLILSTPGVRFILAMGWSHIPNMPDPADREFAYNCLRRFFEDESSAEPAHLSEIIDGAGGTPEDLAHLIILSIEAMVPPPGSTDVHFTHAILDFIVRIDPTLEATTVRRAPLGTVALTLVFRNIVKALTRVACALGESTVPYVGDLRWGCQALEDGLLRALITCARGPSAYGIVGYFKMFVDILIPQQLVYGKALASMRPSLDDVASYL